MRTYSKALKKFKNKIPKDVGFPTALQVTIDDELENALAEVEKNVMSALDLTTLQTRYEIELLWFIYFSKLHEDVMKVGAERKGDLTGPEMVKRLVEILMLNREQDQGVLDEVKAALLKWEV